MAGFADLVRSGVALADALTATLQKDVIHQTWSAATKDDYGKVTWAAGTTRKAIIEPRIRQVKNDKGEVVISTATLTFPRPVAVDPRDRFTLPDGKVALIASTSGAVVDPDAVNGLGYITQVFLV